MVKLVKRLVRRGVNAIGFEIVRYGTNVSGEERLPPDFDAFITSVCESVRQYTMTGPERIFSLCKAVQYIVDAGIPGDIVECGVWKGGSVMAAALTLLERGASDRDIYLFDTFDGMSSPCDVDRDCWGRRASELLSNTSKVKDDIWAYCALDDVRANVLTTGYPSDNLHFVEGAVEETIPDAAPGQISLLRLDTDWYASTYHELIHLYPRLAEGGVLIIDDYGHWSGAKKAVDDYLAAHGQQVLLNRIDYTGRICVKRTN